MKQLTLGVENTVRPTTMLGKSDPVSLKILLRIFAIKNPKIVDVTSNFRKMWRGIEQEHNITFCDVNSEVKPDIICDFRFLPFQKNSVDVLIFDPPFLPTNAASTNSSKIWKERFGITKENETGSDYRTGNNISDCFLPFFREAKKVLTYPNGVIFCKIQDLVHSSVQEWQHVDLILAAREAGLTPCDMGIQLSPAASLMSSKWKNVHHLRKGHIMWIVIRVGKYCTKKG